jgi:hypothetical protein
MTIPNNPSYNQRLADLATKREGLEWFPGALLENKSSHTRAQLIHNGKASRFLEPDKLISVVKNSEETPMICVIERIDPLWIQTFGDAWNLDPDFFLDHAMPPVGNPQNPDDVWSSIMSVLVPGTVAHNKSEHIMGVFEYPDFDGTVDTGSMFVHNFFRRQFWRPKDEHIPMSSNTTISYTRVSPSLCL